MIPAGTIKRTRKAGTTTVSSKLPRAAISNFNYAGAFTIADMAAGESGPSYSHGQIAYNPANNSLYLTGYAPHNAIAEYAIPTLVSTGVLGDLVSVYPPLQGFYKTIERAEGGNPDSMDRITGMGLIDGKLVVNYVENYDADAAALDSTLVIEDPTNLATSAVRGFLRMPGAARSAGWLSPVPPEWQAAIGSSWIAGHSSNTPIFSRHSIGPSAYALDLTSLANATLASPNISAEQIMMYPYSTGQLSNDDYGQDKTNKLWNILAGAYYGFIIPGTSTYAALGGINGIDSGIGYKITRLDGIKCAGYCSYTLGDRDCYYWFYDVNHMIEAKEGSRLKSSLRPYAYGKFPTPHQPAEGSAQGSYTFGGGAFDESSGTLYLSLQQANRTGFYRGPIIIAYTITGL